VSVRERRRCGKVVRRMTIQGVSTAGSEECADAPSRAQTYQVADGRQLPGCGSVLAVDLDGGFEVATAVWRPSR
jgi:hypothetical protein